MFVRTESLSGFIKFYPVVSSLIVIQVALFLVQWVPFIPAREWYELLSGANLAIAEGEIWRLLTPIFLHWNFSHIFFNSVSLILFAPPLERLLGRWKFISLFIITGAMANLFTFLIMPLTYVHIGSSGAIFGLFGFYIAVILFNRQMLNKQMRSQIIPITTIALLLSFFQPNINLTAHFTGFAAGLIVGWLYLRKKDRPVFHHPL
ncbi:MAG TPA: rhomboid family intramembrane serine protease [Chondromyces sp.]|nr:rhomboid family intramembrane serine protease [Chondromyces sp.]